MTPLVRYHTAGAGDLEFERLWLPSNGISIKKNIGKFYYPIAITITQKNRGYLRIFLATDTEVENLMTLFF
jgi:hypothetical protein